MLCVFGVIRAFSKKSNGVEATGVIAGMISIAGGSGVPICEKRRLCENSFRDGVSILLGTVVAKFERL